MSDVPQPALKALKERWAERPDYVAEPEKWITYRMPSTFLWSKQWEIIHSVRDHRQTAVKSCHSAGKSFLAATIAAWWIDSHPPGTAFVVTSAPTGAQVKTILWREMARAHKRGNLPGRMNQLEWYDDGGEIVAFGRKPAEHTPDAFQGIHAMYVLVILDEATGIPKSLWDAASSLTSNENGRILAIGNPDNPDSQFKKVCDMETWHVIRISAFDTPNFTGEAVPADLRLLLVSKTWVDEKVIEWGVDSPIYISKITGEFPTDAEDGVIPMSWLSEARHTEHAPDGDVQAGFDVSGGGRDRSVVWLRQGKRAMKRYEKRGEKDPDKLALWVAELVVEHNVKSIKIDANGLGWGVGALVSNHLPWTTTCEVVPVMVGEAADQPEKFLNRRAELWWTMRDLVRKHEVDLTELDDDDADELVKPRYHMNNPQQRIQVEKKDEIIKRLGRSPDSADALILAFHTATYVGYAYGSDVANARA